MTCRAAQHRIIAEGELERTFNIQNFDSGHGLEDLVRRELRQLLPSRYDISPGVINDATGATAEECDLVISNRFWAPLVKLGATPESRRVHFPIEAVYSIIEVKQTASFKDLDAAMKKLVTSARLKRRKNPYGHITENQHLCDYDKEGYLLNPLHTAILATRPDPDTSFEELARRFFYLNKQVGAVSRDHMVKVLCVLGGGVAYYSVRTGKSSYQNADFCRDREIEIIETIAKIELSDCFYLFFVHLLGHLTRTVLDVVEISHNYGKLSPDVIVFDSVAPPKP